MTRGAEITDMITIGEAEKILDDIANSEIPPEFYKHLNGGISLLPGIRLHPESVNHDLYIIGQYRTDRDLGRYIVIYYGSFIRVYGGLDYEESKKKLRELLLHEFTHHLESLAGERDLEIKDAIDMQKYKEDREKRYPLS